MEEEDIIKNIKKRCEAVKKWSLNIEFEEREGKEKNAINIKLFNGFIKITGFPEREKEIVKRFVEAVVDAEKFKIEKSLDSMTGLYNKEAFMKRTVEIIEKIRKEILQEDKSKAKGRSYDISMVHIDIDHFKRINDTWGHAVGDKVIKSFAGFLENFSYEYLKDKNITIAPGRLGGEEFGIILSNTNQNDARDFAEKLLENLKSGSLLEGLKNMPALSITASIGVATLKSVEIISEKNDPRLLASKLYEDADIATYVAKKMGRARVMLYERILQEGGIIIDYDDRTEIVVIDIGSDVGVNVGDVFKVYDNKKFTGTQPIYEPGSKEKIIGYYPRLPLGEIEVILVQPGVSFARKIGDEDFHVEKGFTLEYVPKEELKRPSAPERRKRERRSKGFVSEKTIFEKRIEELSTREKFVVALIAMDSYRLISDRYGTARTEKIYKKLIKTLDSMLPEGSVMARISNEEIGIIPGALNGFEKIIKNVINEIKTEEGISFSAGVYFASKWEKGRKKPLECARKALDIARFEGGGTVIVFNEESATKKLSFYIKHRDYEHILEEYNNLLKLGLSIKGLKKVYAEALYYFGKLEDALKENMEALKESPEDPEILKNIASIYLEMGKNEEAVQYFEKLEGAGKLNEIAKKDPWVYRDYGIALFNIGRYKEGEEKLSKAIELEDTDAMSYYYRGLCRARNKKNEKAKEDFVKALGLGYKDLSEEASKILGG